MSVDRSGWALCEVKRPEVSALLVENHYLHRMPGVVPCAMGLYVEGELQGALVWALPPRETAMRYGGVTWELARLWLHDDLPKNSESWTIARGIAHIRAAHPTVEHLISYADPAAGHAGTIYKATNWVYEGMTDSDRKTPRWDYYIGERRVGRASHAGEEAIKRRRTPKHRFSMRMVKCAKTPQLP